MILKYRNFTRDKSEGEIQFSWNSAEMIPKGKKKLHRDDSEGGKHFISWNPLIKLVCYLRRKVPRYQYVAKVRSN
jgi:hypothetical protein